jgi:hypothetical protein
MFLTNRKENFLLVTEEKTIVLLMFIYNHKINLEVQISMHKKYE